MSKEKGKEHCAGSDPGTNGEDQQMVDELIQHLTAGGCVRAGGCGTVKITANGGCQHREFLL